MTRKDLLNRLAENDVDIVRESLDHPVHPPYRATGGFLREEAIMILRRFYITENANGRQTKSCDSVLTDLFASSPNS